MGIGKTEQSRLRQTLTYLYLTVIFPWLLYFLSTLISFWYTVNKQQFLSHICYMWMINIFFLLKKKKALEKM